MVFPKTIFKSIRYWRNDRGYKQAYVAAQIDVSLRWYVDLENGKVDFRISHLMAIAKVLEVAPEAFFKELDQKETVNDQQKIAPPDLQNKLEHAVKDMMRQLLEKLLDDNNGEEGQIA